MTRPALLDLVLPAHTAESPHDVVPFESGGAAALGLLPIDLDAG